MSKVKTSVTLDELLVEAGKTACKPENENRDFSNLCEVALTDWLAPRGYLKNGGGRPLKPELLAKLKAVIATDPQAEKEINDVIRNSTRRRRTALV